MPDYCFSISTQLGDAFACETLPSGFTSITTPLALPDGDLVQVFARETNGSVLLTDLGETAGWLHLHTGERYRSDGQVARMEKVCQSNGLDLDGPELTVVTTVDRLAEAVLRLATGILHVSGIVYTLRARELTKFARVVGTTIEEHGFAIDYRWKVSAPTGRLYRVDIHVPESDALVMALPSKTSASARRNELADTYLTFSELAEGEFAAAPKVSVLDTSLTGAWTTGDRTTLRKVSHVVDFSDTERLIDAVRAA